MAKFFADSPLEEAGFEPSVPLHDRGRIVGLHPLFVGSAAYAALKDDLEARGLAYLNTDLPTATLYPDGSSMFLTTSHEENVAAQIGSIQRRAAIAKFVWPIPDRGLAKRLHRVTAPTLLLWGDRDRVNPVVYGETWRRQIKGAALSVLAGGHMLLHEAPEPSATAILAFLDGP